MDRTFRLKPLLDLAQIHADAAARELGKLTAQDMEAGHRLQLLLEYRNSYQQKFQASMRDGLHNTEWHNYREFMLKLDAAIAQQYRTVSGSRERTEAGRQRYRAEQTKLDSYDTLAKRHERKQAQFEDKREQKELDEFATRASFHGQRSLENK